MGKQNVMDVTKEIYKHLEPLRPDDRIRVINAALTLLGQDKITQNVVEEAIQDSSGITKDEKTYFRQKEPLSKVELLAVAARFLEQHREQHKHKREDLQQVIGKARRNFDSHNFSTDIRNAKDKGLFMKGKDIQLSDHGQRYVDTLPNRDALKKLKSHNKKRKKKAKKKT